MHDNIDYVENHTASTSTMAESATVQEDQPRKKFAPKQPVQLNPPKSDPISIAELSKCDGGRLVPPNNPFLLGRLFPSGAVH